MAKAILLVLLQILLATPGKAAPLGTEFTYQGFLTVGGSPASGPYEMIFTLFQQGSTTPGPSRTNGNVMVSLGVFTVGLDFGQGVFDGTAYELAIAVRPGGTTGQFASLLPRQPLTATPNSIRAQTVSSVPDSALSSNVARLDQPASFAAGVIVTTLRVADSTGGGALRFGPTDDCSIGVNPQGPSGLLLRDPSGVRILNPNLGSTRLFFGPTDDCSFGTEPAGGLTGLIERDPVGLRLLGQNNQGCRLIFGPTMDCTVEVDQAGPAGLLLRDPRGIRLLPPGTNAPPRLLFGPTDLCSVEVSPQVSGLLLRDPSGIRVLPPGTNAPPRLLFGPTDLCTVEVSPQFPGLLLRDPSGVRILPPATNNPPRLIFGPTDDCSIGVDPGLSGLLLRDPRGVRIAPVSPMATTRLLFGPTDDCSIGIDPAFPGLVERDPIGFRLLGLNNQGCRLIFGPTMDCTVEVDPAGPQGLLLRDPRGIRILPPPGGPGTTALPRLLFGPTDDCSIGIDPAFPGLVERDPIGFRLLGLNNQGCRLIFGPTMDCTVEVDPAGPQGLLLRDPSGIRILSPAASSPPRLLFGPTDDCSIGIDPVLPGLRLRDPGGIRIAPASPMVAPMLAFGNNPDNICAILVDPQGPAGLLLRDPSGIRVLSPDAAQPPRLLFGPTDDCSLGIDPVLTGLRLRDPGGLRIAPAGSVGLPRLLFGPTDDCSIGIDPAFPGLIERDPIGLRLLGQNNQGGRLIFGPTMACTIEAQPPGGVTGLLLRDPRGIRVLSPAPTGGTNTILFGPTDLCRISTGETPTGGLCFFDPVGFTFKSQVTVNGPVFAQAFVQTSSRRFKNDVKPIEEPLEKIAKLQGVQFTWKEDQGGQPDIGFIAEEVAKVIPEVVAMEEDGKNARGVKYDHLVAVAIEGIKAQQTKIETLEREKTELKDSLATMQARLDKLARQMEALAAR